MKTEQLVLEILLALGHQYVATDLSDTDRAGLISLSREQLFLIRAATHPESEAHHLAQAAIEIASGLLGQL